MDSQGVQTIRVGISEWKKSEFSLGGDQVKAAVSGTWHSRKKFVITLHLLGTPLFDTWTFDFIGRAVRLTTVRNICFIPDLSDQTLMPNITGHVIEK